MRKMLTLSFALISSYIAAQNIQIKPIIPDQIDLQFMLSFTSRPPFEVLNSSISSEGRFGLVNFTDGSRFEVDGTAGYIRYVDVSDPDVTHVEIYNLSSNWYQFSNNGVIYNQGAFKSTSFDDPEEDPGEWSWGGGEGSSDGDDGWDDGLRVL
ncbi:MAG: hypothetical protein HY014_10175 [Acidobacteria bacterium]|nr:hypothetical protein [Acidobacteriota bacterium]MBI3488522.1 hypothetical protein [Acidobacteriota bacterium]